MNIIELFSTISNPDVSNGNLLSGLVIPGYELHRIAKDSRGTPLLLISSDEKVYSPPIQLESLIVYHGKECTISYNDGRKETRIFSIVHCTSEDKQLQQYFLKMLEIFMNILGPTPTPNEISHIVYDLTKLFRSLSLPSKKTIQGLWGELFIISRAQNPLLLLESWHSSPEDLYDFTSSSQRIEVKTTRNHIRKHHFSLLQLQPPSGVVVVIASIITERSDTGTSINDLVDSISKKVNYNSHILFKLNYLLMSTLGDAWKKAQKEAFDYDLAKSSLQFYLSDKIPRVECNDPEIISDVHFQVNITSVSSMEYNALRKLGGISRGVLQN